MMLNLQVILYIITIIINSPFLMKEINPQIITYYSQLYIINDRILAFVSECKKYILTFFVLHLCMALYYSVVAYYFHIEVVGVTVSLHALVSVIMIYLAFIDPGIITKNIQQKETQWTIPYDKKLVIIDGGMAREYINRVYSCQIKGSLLVMRFCSQCCIYRPPRTSHCHTCDVCIQKMDHHCPWLGICIGKGNYKFYLLYLLLLIALFILIYYQVISMMISKEINETIVELVFSIILFIMIPISIFTTLLFAFHLHIAAKNITTNQFLHEKWDTLSGNPFQKSFFLKNILKVIKKCYYSNLQTEKEFQSKNLSVKQQKQRTTGQQLITQNYKMLQLSLHASEIHLKVNDQGKK